MRKIYEVELREEIHPLQDLDKMDSYGFLMAGIQNLDETLLLSNIKGFHLNFFGGDIEDNYELWANPLRIKVLQRLVGSQRHLYLSFIGVMDDESSPTGYISIEQGMMRGIIQEKHLDFVVINSPEQPAGFRPRIFLEVPKELIPTIVNRYWTIHYPGYPIQGLVMSPGQSDLLQKWSNEPKNTILFKTIIDAVYVLFQTYPSENRHFYFLTNKLCYSDVRNLIDIDDLQRDAAEFGNKI